MEYRKIPPPDHLKDYIRYFWTWESTGENMLSRSFQLIVEGHPGLIFQSPEKPPWYQWDMKFPSIFLYGQSTRYGELHFGGDFSVVGICFYPNALKTIFGLDADELTNACTCLDQVARKDGFLLSEQLADTASLKDKISFLSAYLTVKLAKNNKYEDKAMQFAISNIVQSKGCMYLPHLHTMLQLSERSFERRFKQYVGISPKLFSRISRFQASLHVLRLGSYDKLSDIAYENEYTDQSHFIRSFKEFAGCPPFRYQQLLIEKMDHLYETPL